MSTAVIPVELPETVLEDAQRLAEQSGMSVSSWIARTVEQQLRDQELAREFFRRRANGRTGADLIAILDKAPDVPPMPGDELPD